ncbi:Uncharacterised protein [Mycobacteroides abscessus subsp. massiliense]|nr:Uncharacterised protein [Mycobacteroides abscessus subsp. massiliense]
MHGDRITHGVTVLAMNPGAGPGLHLHDPHPSL